ncbi:MAG TPA: amidohydrolase family protein [Candidatus Limnocylindria bacterium]
MDGATLLPGLVNAHEHLALKHMRGKYYDLHLQEDRLQLVRAAQAALVSLAEGITTTRDCGAYASLNVALRGAIEGRVARGPRVITCVQVIQPAQEKAAPLSMSREADDAAAVARVASELLDEGADFIKVKVPRSVTSAIEARAFTVEELRAATEVAHAADKPITFHAMTPADVRTGIEAGADAIEHGLGLHEDPTVLDEMAKHGVIFVPCWTSWAASQHGTSERNERHRGVVRSAIEKGVALATGTDLYGLRLYGEIAALAELGLGPEGAIEAATRVGARLCRRDDVGTLEPGKCADIVAVDGDPLGDLRVLGSPRLVLKDGEVAYRAARDAVPLQL